VRAPCVTSVFQMPAHLPTRIIARTSWLSRLRAVSSQAYTLLQGLTNALLDISLLGGYFIYEHTIILLTETTAFFVFLFHRQPGAC